MRKAEVAVPSELMSEFAEGLETRDLEGRITGTNDDNEILVEVNYEKDETKVVDDIEAALTKRKEELEEEEEDDDEDDEDED
jgi:hypothetical protein